jgi:hypothetical protein
MLEEGAPDFMIEEVALIILVCTIFLLDNTLLASIAREQ